MSIFNVMIKGHTLEFRTSSSGSIDPWTMDYASEHKIGLIGTADIKDFVKVDNTWIYKITRGFTASSIASILTTNLRLGKRRRIGLITIAN